MTFNDAVQMLKDAKTPEDVFGYFAGIHQSDQQREVKAAYTRLAVLLHPDKNKHSTESVLGFQHLGTWYDQAKTKIENQTYGNRNAIKPVTIRTKKSVYVITERHTSGDICEMFQASDQQGRRVILKVCRTPGNSDLVRNEAKVLQALWEAEGNRGMGFMRHVAEPVLDIFDLKLNGKKQVTTAHKFFTGGVTLLSVMRAFPHGVNLADAAWMWNRLLAAMLAGQSAGIAHGAILPQHFLVYPEDHNGQLVEWSYAGAYGSKRKAVLPHSQAFYPPEILDKSRPLTLATDVYMMAKTMIALLTGSFSPASPNVVLDPRIPPQVRGLLQSCLLHETRRPDDIQEFAAAFNQALERQFGPRKWRPFAMPPAPVAA